MKIDKQVSICEVVLREEGPGNDAELFAKGGKDRLCRWKEVGPVSMILRDANMHERVMRENNRLKNRGPL